MRCAATVCLEPSLSKGPWIYWHDLEGACADASAAGLDGIELFTGSADQVDAKSLQELLERTGLALAAVGTGAGKVLHGLTLTDEDDSVRAQAREFVAGMIQFGAPFGAPAIIGSMQGAVPPGGDRPAVLDRLRESLVVLDGVARDNGISLIYEPLNRYESNLLNTQAAARDFLDGFEAPSIRLLADLFHMNIEEVSIPSGIRDGGDRIGHVHLADSNRRPAGGGHSDLESTGAALRGLGYTGWISAEAFPWPDPATAARATSDAFARWFAG